MPELTVIHFGLLAAMLVVGAILGWILRSDRCAREKIAVNASWQDQLESQQSEHNRLAEQNKSLMEQISQYQASHKDTANRARELSESLREAFAKRDELQRQLKDMRSNLGIAIAQRNRLRDAQPKNPEALAATLKEKDDKIFKLSRELTSWQSRVPPLVERFQEKSQEVVELQAELQKAHARLQALEDLVRSDQTRIEPVDADALPGGGDASNEPIAMTSSHCLSNLHNDNADDDVVSIDEFVDPLDENEELPVVGDEEFDSVFSEHEDAIADDNSKPPGEVAFDAVFDADIAPAADDIGIDSAGDDLDDLKMIKGIGPAIEKTLNDLGVYRYHQIAEMSEYDIDRVAQQLKGFRSRIYREDWIGQARDLQYEKSNKRG